MSRLSNYFLFAHPINISCRIYSYLATAVPADEPCYVTQCYQYTPDGYPEQDGCITSVYFQRYSLYLGKSQNIFFITQDYAAADLCITGKKDLL